MNHCHNINSLTLPPEAKWIFFVDPEIQSQCPWMIYHFKATQMGVFHN